MTVATAKFSYDEFLASKRLVAAPVGFEVDDSDISPMLFPFQRHITKWTLQRGRAAVWADCFLPGTLIRTDGKYRPIEECTEGMEIETLDGPAEIEKTMSRIYDGEILDITTSSGFFPISVTLDHKFYVLKRDKCVIPWRENVNCSPLCDRVCPIDNPPHKLYRIELSKAKDLKVDDCLLFRQPREIQGQSIQSDNGLRLAGYWLAEGHLTYSATHRDKLYGIHLNFSLDEEETLVKDSMEVFRNLGMKSKVFQYKRDKNVLVVSSSHHLMASWLKSNFGELSHGKRIPGWFYSLSRKQQILLLSNLFRGDAHIRLVPYNDKLIEHIKYVTVSYELASGVRDALLGLGIRCSATVEKAKIDKNGVNHRECYRIQISKRFMNEFGFDLVDGKTHTRQIEHYQDGQVYTLIPITKIEQRKYNGNVYNLTSSGHDSYLTDAGMSKNCGLGKSPCQLEFAKHVSKKTDGPVLIFAPLAVSKQTKREGEKFGIPVTVCESQIDVKEGVNITNYEKIHHFDCNKFTGVVIDESSILKGFDGKMRQLLTDFAKPILYRGAYTATPAPNELIEVINHSEFLGIMSGKEIKALFFVQDGNSTQKWRLKNHAREAFWQWLASWAVALRKPSDLGYDDIGFILPELRIHEIMVESKPLEGYLFPVEANTMSERREARRSSLSEKVKVCVDLVDGSKEPWLFWCDLNAESEALSKAIPGAVEVKGSDSIRHKESSMLGFSDMSIQSLVTKSSICGWGMNWQHCCKMALVGISDSFEAMYQIIRRCWRFGQVNIVDVYLILSQAEGSVLANIRRKERDANEMMDQVVSRMKRFSLGQAKKDEMIYQERIESGESWKMYLGDSVKRVDEIKSESVDLVVSSLPFPGLYAYSNSPMDIGNTKNHKEMLDHYRFLVARDKLLRILKPGRTCAIHLIQIPVHKSTDGYIGLRDFRGDVIRLMEEEGWIYYGEVCIDKSPQAKAVRTKDASLQFKSLANDSSRMRMALADYMLQFRKPGDNKVPIRAGISRKYKNENGWITNDEWILWARPVWYGGDLAGDDGIYETDVLKNYKLGRESDDEKHLCPLQLGVCERAIKLWSNPGETVFDPFGGIASIGYEAVKLNRKFVGCELKESYWKIAVKNLKRAEKEASQKTLFPLAGSRDESEDEDSAISAIPAVAVESEDERDVEHDPFAEDFEDV